LQLAKTEQENIELREQMGQGGGAFNPMVEGEEFEPFELEDNIDNLKKMQIPDANFLRKINEADQQFMRSSVEKKSAVRSSAINPFPLHNSGATIPY